jgi:inner membrane protein
MPSIGHVAVGIAAGRWRAGHGEAGAGGWARLRCTAAYALLATFPDADAFARKLGAVPGSVWLHRGALHALPVALAAAVLVSLVLERGRLRAGPLLAAFAAAASHGLLDTFTHGGAGVMLLWPFSHVRWLAPWTPVPASPMGARLLSARGLAVMAEELALFVPLVAYALWPLRRGRSGAVGAADASPPA